MIIVNVTGKVLTRDAKAHAQSVFGRLYVKFSILVIKRNSLKARPQRSVQFKVICPRLLGVYFKDELEFLTLAIAGICCDIFA